ncbi:MAG: FtsX-like permease family protein [Vallitaleaceae bacterium]|jgi:putative ABC transport system permease protein|nr:FtsX-like permease family protein [Vallitaleaceae bacterium]
MRIILKTGLAMLKRKKGQSVLIGIIIMLMATLLYTGIAMINQSSPAEIMFKRANATENVLILNKDTDDVEATTAWWENRDEVSDTILYEALMINADYTLDGKIESELSLITEYRDDSDLDILYKTGTLVSEAPSGNEILLNYNFARNRNLEKGENFSFTFNDVKYDFTISGFVVDPHFSNAFISVNRCFVEPGFFEKNNMVNTQAVLGIKYKDIMNIDDIGLYEQFKKETGSEPLYVDYQGFILTYNLINGIIAAILLAVSLFIFAIVIFVIRSVIRNLILQQYKQIGVKKVIGYTNHQIRSSFIYIYGFIGLIASIVGVLIGLPLRNNINAGISYDIQVGLESGFDIFVILTVLIVVLLIVLFTFLATKQANKIKPVQAIKYGMPENKVTTHKFNITKSKVMPLSILLAIKQMLVNRKKTITTTITITILIYVAFLINSTGYSLADDEHFITYLFGYEVGDFAVVNNSNNSVQGFIDTLETIDSVDSAVFFMGTTGESTVGFTPDSNVSISGFILYGNYPENGVILEAGRQPKNDFEIIITSDIAKKTEKTVGDYMVIKGGEIETKYMISGIYNSITNNGSSYLAIRKSIPTSVLQNSGTFWVYSNEEHVIIEEMEKTIGALVDEPVSVVKYDANVKNVLSTIEAFPIMIKSLLVIFLIICGVIILNSTIMDISNATRSFGIMKATGYSNSSITKIMVIKSVIVTGFGVVIGFVLNLLTADIMMQGVFSLTPFSSITLPVLFDFSGSILIMGLFILIAIIATLIPARRVSQISPRILITE